MKSIISSAFLLANIASVFAYPTPSSNNGTDLETRFGAGDIVKLVMLIHELIENKHNAYDTDIPNNCVIHTSTYAGGSCSASIACGTEIGTGRYAPIALSPGPGQSTDTWNACFLNGRQYFNDPRVGDFSIQFTQAGGVNSDRDGLHHPFYQFAQIGDWEVIDAQADADKVEDSGHICTTSEVAGTQTIDYWCGVPQLGQTNFGLTNDPIPDQSYIPGTCGIHWIQYQIPSGGGSYGLALRIVDNDQNLIGEVGNSYLVGGDHVDASSPVDVTSALPWVLVSTVVTPGSVPDTDAEPVKFAYADQFWDTNSAQCSTGAYDSGSRQGDCSFSC